MEKFNYYVVFSFLNPEGQIRITCRYISRDRAIETQKDVQSLAEDGVFGDYNGITVINWKRLQ